MIGAMSAATNGVRTAMARFDRAAMATVSAANELGAGADTTGLAGGIIDMDAARLAASASLVVARASFDMLDEVIRLGGYGTQDGATV